MIDFSPAIEKIQQMIDDLIRLLPNIVVGLVIILLFYLVSRLVGYGVERLSDRYRRSRNLGVLLGRIARWTVLLLGMLVALVIIFPTFSPAQLIQLLGIGSLAFSFAFRDILENFFAGILLLINEPFRYGDQILVDEAEGTVESIETRATTIRTYDGRRIVIPNAILLTNKVTVNTAFENRRLEYDVGIGYGDDIRLARQLILDAVRESEGVLEKPIPDVLLLELADFSTVLRARWWISPPFQSDLLEAYDHVLQRIKEKLTANGIDLPFPTQQILFHDQTEETDGDRRRQREGWPAGNGPVPGPLRRSSR